MRFDELGGGPFLHALVLAVGSGLLVIRLLGAARSWPWRIADLVADPPGDPAPDSAADSTAAAGSERRRRPPGVGATPRMRPRRDRSLDADLLVVIDRLRLAVSAGHSLHRAVALTARDGDGPACAALARAVAGYERGARLVDELERLPTTADPAFRPLCTALVLAASSGAPLGPALDRLATTERRRLRRRSEERVRRLPILLLAPMVGLILPAFVLLTIVPVGYTTARAALVP